MMERMGCCGQLPSFREPYVIPAYAGNQGSEVPPLRFAKGDALSVAMRRGMPGAEV